jgi:hypothetical protein
MAYANVAIAPPAPSALPDIVLSDELRQQISDLIWDALNGRQSVTPLTPFLAPAEPVSSTLLPPKELPSPCSPAIEPPADESNSCLDCSPVDEPPSVQVDVPVQPVQPRLPSCRLRMQTTPLVLSCAPSASILYISWCLDKPWAPGGAILVDFRDTG